MPDDDLPALPVVPTGRYRHYKGNQYELVGAVRHSETLETLALYRPLYGEGALWVRPWAMFFETVVIDGVAQPRFQRLDPPADQPAGSSS
jgi:hypothetical protein